MAYHKGNAERPREKGKHYNNRRDRSQSNFYFQKRKKCFNCNKYGHIASVCRAPHHYGNGEDNIQHQNRHHNQHQRKNNRNINSNNSCERCGKFGHNKRTCRTIVCDYCGIHGHKAPDCRKKQRDHGGKQHINENNDNSNARRRTCYECGGTNHIAKDCKSVTKVSTERQRPFPQKRHLNEWARVPRNVVKDWTAEELRHAKEFHRLNETKVMIYAMLARHRKELELLGEQRKIVYVHHDKATDTKRSVTHTTQLEPEYVKLDMKIKEFETDARNIENLLTAQVTTLLKQVLETAKNLDNFEIVTSDAAVESILQPRRTVHREEHSDEELDNFAAERVMEMAHWANKMRSVTLKKLKEEAKAEADKVIARHARKAARDRANAIEEKAATCPNSPTKRSREADVMERAQRVALGQQ